MEFEDDIEFEDDLPNPAVKPTENPLVLVVAESGLEKTKADIILKKFSDYFAIASEWETKAKKIIVTDEKQTFEMETARAGRLLLRKRRIEIENTRKELKEQSLREGKAIDGIANVLKALIVPIEEHLERQEKFVELKLKQEEELKRIEAEKKAEEERIAKEKSEAEERERIRKENEQLRKEAVERERQLAVERAKHEAEKRRADEKARREREAIEQKLTAEKAEAKRAADAERAEAKRIAEEEYAKKVAEIAKKNAELAKAKKIADDARAEAERLRGIITCPKCGHKFEKE